MFGSTVCDSLWEDLYEAAITKGRYFWSWLWPHCLAARRGASANPGSSPEILGYLNPGNNSFRPMYMQPIGNPSVVSVATGKIVTTFTITVSSVLPSTAPISCNVSAGVNDVSTTTFVLGNEILEQASVIATRNVGTAKCIVTIPYSWNLSFRTTDKVNLSYSIVATSNSTAAGSEILSHQHAIYRLHKHSGHGCHYDRDCQSHDLMRRATRLLAGCGKNGLPQPASSLIAP